MSDDERVTVNPASVVACPLCHGAFPVLEGTDGQKVVVQPFPVEVVAPHRARIQSRKPISPTGACVKALEGSMTVRKYPPVFVPHVYCCPGAGELPPLFQALPNQEEDQHDEGIDREDSGAPEEAQNGEPRRSCTPLPMPGPGRSPFGAGGGGDQDKKGSPE